MTGPAAPASGRRRPGRWRLLLAGALAVVTGAGIYLAAGRGTAAPRPGGHGARPPAAASGPAAPGGTFTAVGGMTVTIASLRGKPAMVWFVAGGCASCAASIPAVAAHLRQLTAGGLRVVTLGLAGDFPAGKQGLADLSAFGRAAAGGPVTRPGWIWGIASQGLSQAHDPGGTPDVYALISPSGHITYRGSVPVSTMPQLLAAARSIAYHTARQPPARQGASRFRRARPGSSPLAVSAAVARVRDPRRLVPGGSVSVPGPGWFSRGLPAKPRGCEGARVRGCAGAHGNIAAGAEEPPGNGRAQVMPASRAGGPPGRAAGG